MADLNDTLETIAVSQASETASEDTSTQDKVNAGLESLDAVGTAVLTDAAEGLASAAGALAEDVGGAVGVAGSILGGLLEFCS